MSDLEDSHPPFDLSAVTARELDPRWRLELVEETTSTNADVAERFRGGEPEGLVLVAEHQTAGRGRLGREWVTPGPHLADGVVPAGARRGAGRALAVAAAADRCRRGRAVRRVAGVRADLKWPNDVLADGLKLGGILLERVEHAGAAAAVVGIGVNCAQSSEELPVPEATSLALVAGQPVDRAALLGALLVELAGRYDEWRSGGDLRGAYLELCGTPGQDVRVAVPGGEVVGRAVDVDTGGRLVVRTEAGEQRLGAGDVVHVRPEAPSSH